LAIFADDPFFLIFRLAAPARAGRIADVVGSAALGAGMPTSRRGFSEWKSAATSRSSSGLPSAPDPTRGSRDEQRRVRVLHRRVPAVRATRQQFRQHFPEKSTVIRDPIPGIRSSYSWAQPLLHGVSLIAAVRAGIYQGGLYIPVCDHSLFRTESRTRKGGSAMVKVSVVVPAIAMSLVLATPGSVASPPSPPTAPPKRIPITIPLRKAPKPGKTAGYVICNLPTCKLFEPGYKAAAAALHWKTKFFVYSSTNPQASVYQAIQARVDYISITGASVAQFQSALAAAKKANIPVIEQSATDPDNPKAGLYANIGGAPTYGNYTKVMSQWMVKDSRSKANVVFVNIHDFPILATGEKQARSNLTKICSACSFDTLEVTVNDLGSGAVPSKVVAYLQTHPKVNYVEVSFGDLIIGLPEALKAAGFASKAKLISISATQPVLEGIANGTIAAGNVQPQGYFQWVHFDRFARLSEGSRLVQQKQAELLPTYVIANRKAANALLKAGGVWDGPIGYRAAFKKLWHVK
jgi:ribose transport system substrate-binding protein